MFLFTGAGGRRGTDRANRTEHKIEECVHFAALAYVGESVAEPARYFENNVEQGVALMGSSAESGHPALCFFFHLRHLRRARADAHF